MLFRSSAPLPLRAADSKMFQLSDELGRPLFENIQISLVCSECLKTDEPEKCTHKMAEMPRWLSSSKMAIVPACLPTCLPTSLQVAVEFEDGDREEHFVGRPGNAVRYHSKATPRGS